MQVDMLENTTAGGVGGVQAGALLFTHKYGWVEVAEVHAPEMDEMFIPSGPYVLDLVEEQADGATSLRYSQYAQVLFTVALLEVDSLVEDPPPAEPTYHTVWRDASTGEYVSEEYAIANPDTTVSEQVLDDGL